MLSITGGVFRVEEGILFLNGALVEYEESLLPMKPGIAAITFQEIIAMMQVALPEVEWWKNGHVISNCHFKATVFNLENE